MEHLKLEVPSIERKEEAIDYIQEHWNYHSHVNGSGSLHKYVDRYEEWLQKLESDYAQLPSESKVPARTYFLVREEDNKIVGMINIRLALNDKLKKSGGHIGYGIRPTERNKGYNKINLYLGLKICQQYGLEEVLLDADIENVASWKTMEALGGKRVEEYYDEEEHRKCVKYKISVDKSIQSYHEIYEKQIMTQKR